MSAVAWRDVGTILHRRNFRTLLYARLSGQLADGFLQSALATFVLFSPERQTSPSAIAASFIVLYLPYSFIGPFAGILLDRWRRRNVLVRANLLRAMSIVPLMVLVAADRADAWLAVGVLVTVGLGRFVLAGLGASLPHVVEPSQLMLANSFKPTAGTLAYAFGALTGIAIRSAAGGGDQGSLVVLGCTLIAYIAAGLWPLRLAPGGLGPTREAPTQTFDQVLYEFAGGARELARCPAAAKSLVIVLVNRVMVGALTVMLLLVLRNRIYPPDQPDAALGSFALVAAGVTVGAFLAAMLTPWFGKRLGPVGWTCTVAVLAGLLITPALFVLSVGLLIAAAPLVGLSNQSAKICSDSIIQHRIPDPSLGRVFALVDLIVNIGLVAGVSAVAFLAPPDGVTAVGFLALGVGYLLVAAWYWTTRDRTLQSDPVFA